MFQFMNFSVLCIWRTNSSIPFFPLYTDDFFMSSIHLTALIAVTAFLYIPITTLFVFFRPERVTENRTCDRNHIGLTIFKNSFCYTTGRYSARCYHRRLVSPFPNRIFDSSAQVYIDFLRHPCRSDGPAATVSSRVGLQGSFFLFNGIFKFSSSGYAEIIDPELS